MNVLPSSKYIRSRIVFPNGKSLVESYISEGQKPLPQTALKLFKNADLSSGYIGSLRLTGNEDWLIGFPA